MTHRKKFIITLLGNLAAIFGLLAGMSGCSKQVEEETADVVRPAKLITLQVTSDIRSIQFPAIIKAKASVDLTFQVGGLLQEFPVNAGNEVEKGALIGKLDQREFQNQLTSAQAQYDNAKTELERAERLLAEKAIANTVYDQRKAQHDVAMATLESAQKVFDDTVLHAPFSGVIAQTHVDQFQNVGPTTAVVTLQSVGVAQAEVQVPANVVANAARIEPFETHVLLDAVPGVRIPAELGSVSTQADPDTQTFTIKFTFSPPSDLNILPGMTGTVESKLRITGASGSSSRLTIPIGAILSDGEDKFAWVVDPETMTVERRALTLGVDIGDTLEVLEGLEPGEVVVGAGASYLFEGMKVRPFEQ